MLFFVPFCNFDLLTAPLSSCQTSAAQCWLEESILCSACTVCLMTLLAALGVEARVSTQEYLYKTAYGHAIHLESIDSLIRSTSFRGFLFDVPQAVLALMGFSRTWPRSLDLLNFADRECCEKPSRIPLQAAAAAAATATATATQPCCRCGCSCGRLKDFAPLELMSKIKVFTY